MTSCRHIRVDPIDGPDAPTPQTDNLDSVALHLQGVPLRRAIMRTRQWLLRSQHAEGYWAGELEGDTILESEYILLLAFLGRHDGEHARKAARYLLEKQLLSGGWAIYPGGKIDISASVKAYFALKLTGHDPSSASMQQARSAILAHGGADAVNSFTRFYLALLGQISYDQCPAVPPEVVLVPKWFPINMYGISAWTRTIAVPLSIISAHRPVKKIDSHLGIAELFLRRPEDWPPPCCPGKLPSRNWLSWNRFFRLTDVGLKLLERRRWLPLRRRAIAAAERWMIQRFDGSEGLGAIFPPMVWSTVALKCLGYDDDSPEAEYCRTHLEGLIIEQEGTIRLQPCKSPVWDTAISLRALTACGTDPRHEAVGRAVDWLLSQEIRHPGDWSATVQAQPGGWCFEHANRFYPDVDDTVMVLMALRGQFDTGPHAPRKTSPILELLDSSMVGSPAEARRRVVAIDRILAACRRGEQWVLAMQNRDGGWGAFDRDNNREFLCHVPFADHNAMIDPSTPDLTGRVLEALGQFGHTQGQAAIDRAVAYIRRTQEADGSWFGRWGVNYTYGTWQALVGLAAVGVPRDDAAMTAGANWLLAHQQPSGGWGESPDSYADSRLRGQGPTTASQTAWAVLGLMAAGRADHGAVARGIRYLLAEQRPDGSWNEPEFTGTGFPQVFYLRYHMYPIYFPLLALAQWASTVGTGSDPAVALGTWLGTSIAPSPVVERSI